MAEKWEDQVRNLKTEQAPQDLLDRITTVVPHLKQMAEEPVRAHWLVRFMSDWQYGIAFKLAAFATVAVLGVLAGSASGEGQNMLASMVFGDIGWENVI
jgi:hypothetical protein